MKKAFLQKKLARLQERRTALMERGKASQDVNEVRSINDQIGDLDAEIEEVQEEINMIEEEESRSAAANTAPVNGQIVESFQAKAPATATRNEGDTSSMEYRNAFMNYIMRGTPIPANLRVTFPAEVRAGQITSVEDTGAAIPVTVMNEVINTIQKRYGGIYGRARKLSVPGGVEFPVGELTATFKWINDSTVSPDQKAGSLGSVVFKYNIAELRLTQTFLSQLLTLSSFESQIAGLIADAYLEAMDKAIVNGSGNGAPLGILNDPAVANNSSNIIQMSSSDMSNWKSWRKNFFAKLPLGYKAGCFIFPNSTVESYLETMSDDNNNPIFRQAAGLEVGDGDAEFPVGRFFGRDVDIVEEDVIPDFDTANVGDVVGIFWNPKWYAVNENFGFTVRKYFDENENKWVTKSLTVTDGRVLNPKAFYLIKKKAN